MRPEVSIPNGDKHDFKLDDPAQEPGAVSVSIPNGDKHDFKLDDPAQEPGAVSVSIPNGDKHDFKRPVIFLVILVFSMFQSPMGISTISN